MQHAWHEAHQIETRITIKMPKDHRIFGLGLQTSGTSPGFP